MDSYIGSNVKNDTEALKFTPIEKITNPATTEQLRLMVKKQISKLKKEIHPDGLNHKFKAIRDIDWNQNDIKLLQSFYHGN